VKTASFVEAGPSVLVIEDDIDTSARVCRELEGHGFNTVAAFSGEEGLSVLNSHSFGLVLLDWMLPGCSGLSVLKTMRARGNVVPVFLVSMLDALEERVLGLENGADDYVVKPFEFPELLARIRARLRRTWDSVSLPRRIGDLVLHADSRRVLRAGRDAAVTPREFDMLLYLVQHYGTVVTRDMFARDVWRVVFRTASLDNAIDVHVAHLRRKVDADHEVKLIHTVRGEGFMIVEKPAVQL
jgi:two-component system, OmpR family, copper resistance phosphate regulon response regulator CusR